jgi:hypothetical protein
LRGFHEFHDFQVIGKLGHGLKTEEKAVIDIAAYLIENEVLCGLYRILIDSICLEKDGEGDCGSKNKKQYKIGQKNSFVKSCFFQNQSPKLCKRLLIQLYKAA